MRIFTEDGSWTLFGTVLLIGFSLGFVLLEQNVKYSYSIDGVVVDAPRRIDDSFFLVTVRSADSSEEGIRCFDTGCTDLKIGNTVRFACSEPYRSSEEDYQIPGNPHRTCAISVGP